MVGFFGLRFQFIIFEFAFLSPAEAGFGWGCFLFDLDLLLASSLSWMIGIRNDLDGFILRNEIIYGMG